MLVLLALLLPLCDTRQPNIIYILADDLGHADLGFTGGVPKTPNLDQLSREAVVLEQHYVQQVCSATRGALLAGRYPIHTGLQHDFIYPGEPWGLPTEETIIPQILKQYNYSTHAVGKWHLGMHKWSYTPLNRGFDTFFGFYLGGQDYRTHISGIRPGFDFRSDSRGPTGLLQDELRHDLDGRYSMELYTEHTIDLLQQAKSQPEPFFIYLALQNVHAPHKVPQYYVDKYSRHIVNQKEKVFAAMVSAMDEGVGNITRALYDTGLAANTIVVFSSDNGGNVNCVNHLTSSNWPLRGGKRSLYEGGIKSPSFVWSPSLLTPSTTAAMIHVTDWLPTFHRLASINYTLSPNNPIHTQTLDGVDQWEAISTMRPSNRDHFIINIDPAPIHCGHQVPNAAVRWRDWKLILGGGGPPSGWYHAPTLNSTPHISRAPFSPVELYNIAEDTSEHHECSLQHPDIVKHLTQLIEQYNKTMVPPGNKSYDPASDPANYNGTWMPWLGEEVEVGEGEYRLSEELWSSGNPGLDKTDLDNFF